MQPCRKRIKIFSDFEHDDGIHRFDITDKVPAEGAFALLYVPNIIELHISGLTEINVQDFVECISYVRKLQFITLDECIQFSPYHLMKIFYQLKELRWISLVKCMPLQCTHTYCILSSCPKLKFIEFELSDLWSSVKDWNHLRALFFKVRFGRRVNFP